MSHHNAPCSDKSKNSCTTSTPKGGAQKGGTRDASEKGRGNISQDRQRNMQNEKHGK